MSVEAGFPYVQHIQGIGRVLVDVGASGMGLGFIVAHLMVLDVPQRHLG